jgi:signal transduction histidine kinase
MNAARLRQGLEVLLLGGVYVCVALAGLKINAVSGFATLVWPPSGLALAVLLRRGLGLWPGVALGAFVTNLWVGAPVGAALGIACGNTLEAVSGAWLLARFAGLDRPLERLRQVAALVVLGALGTTLVSAAIGVLSLRAAGTIADAQMGATFRAWWVGDALGELVVAPLIIVFSDSHELFKRPARVVEAAVLTALLLGMSLLVFGGWISPASPFGQVYLLFPVLAWAALRFHLRGGTFATLLLSAVAVACTVYGRGPFVRGSVADSLMFLQVFMAMVAITTLFLGAAISERDRAVRARQSLLAIVSHDLKNPLNAIGIHAQLLARKVRDDAALMKLVAQVERSVDRMGLLVRDLLDASALEAGELTLHLDTVEAGPLLVEAAEHMRGTAEKRSQTLRLDVATGLHARGDRDRLLQVLLNLIENALKFAPDGSTVNLAVAPATGQLRFSVSDSGPGIPPEELPRIFDAFWSGSQTSSGSGLGLSISKRIIEAHGGRLWAESALGKGSTFLFELPEIHINSSS